MNKGGGRSAIQVVSKTATSREAILREWANWRRVKGAPHVCGLERVCEDTDRIYFVSEHCRGGNLQRCIDDGTVARSWDDYMELPAIAYQLTRAVHACHSKGVVHACIQPSNVLLYRPWRLGIHCKLSDFGHSLKTDDEALRSTDTMLLGNSIYMLAFGKAFESGRVETLKTISNSDMRNFLELTLQGGTDPASLLSHPWFKRIPIYMQRV